MFLRRLATWSAIVAAVCAVVLGLLQSAIWNGPEAPALARAAGSLVAAIARLPEPVAAAGTPPPVYFAFGRPFLVVYALLALALAAHPSLGRRLRAWLLSLLFVAALGDLGTYWISAELGSVFRKFAFWSIEVPALALVLLSLGVRGALAIWRRDAGDVRWLASAPVWAVAATAGLRYLPHGPVLGLCIALALSASRAPSVSEPAGRSLRLTLLVTLAFFAFSLWLSHALPYRPRPVVGRPAQGVAVFGARCADLKLHVFNTGINRMSQVLVPPPRPWRPVPAFAIEHARAGLLLYDTGLSPEVAREGESALPWPLGFLFESRGLPERRFDVQLARAGLSRVHTIVLSHHHEDHTGTVAAFAGAHVLTGDKLTYERAGPRPFDRSHDLFGDGCVLLIAGGGHAPDDVMALLALPHGPVLLTGDAVVHFSWLDSDDVERIATDRERAAAVRNQVRAFLGRVAGAAIIPGHDLSRIPTDRADVILHQPEWFTPAAWKH